MRKPQFITDINKVIQISEEERNQLQEVTSQFAFRANDYYLKLINWEDPSDPIRKLVIPHQDELAEYGRWDASDEEHNYVAPGCQHKYETTALLLVSEVCGAYCRYCFRKRLFLEDVHESTVDISKGLSYIQQHPEINNVLLTGGDPLTLSTARIEAILKSLREIDHVKVIRIGSKIPVFNPMRIYEDEHVLEVLKKYSRPDQRIYVVTHINHPREITPEALQCFNALQSAGVVLVNQTPILRGINDHAGVLAELLNRLSWAGVAPYYFFVNRPVVGNSAFVLPLKRIYDLVEEAKSKTSGFGKRVRLVMSHSSGKIEILAIENGMAYLKYHQSKEGDYGKMMILPCSQEAAWFDDLPGSEKHLRGTV
ncbi:KamA family radical SAM protein [Tumebacillus sp. ITR2]|uniref:KamA family radical SAM protein n=1 Tax=Tumebacillus amylolyticus TaxID=2801339 RepID=A0ABS1J5L4_9BACL|nr:KamA family radical SAM protein [Tumebacillus amylolyticus]MBL0385576.1 KamA family radical SAM protein [Tumebacillus amylolyticus]